MTARYLVTGGAGYVGSHLAAALLERGLSVTVIDDLSTGHRAAVLAGVRLVEGDLADPSVLDPVLADGPWRRRSILPRCRWSATACASRSATSPAMSAPACG